MYSSILKVITYLNDSSLALTNSTNLLYVPIGVLPKNEHNTETKNPYRTYQLVNQVQRNDQDLV